MARFRIMRRPFIRLAALALLVTAVAIGMANYHVISANQARLCTDLAALPDGEVGLVLGTSPYLKNGRINLHFRGRIEAAAALYRAGKVKHLLVSGDNRHQNYNEPAMMRTALIDRGVPGSAITADFAGFRTLDSVVRAKSVFGLHRCIIITQRYHNTRALEIARATGLDAWGYCAADAGFRDSIQTECREVLARTVTLLDLYVWHRQPHFLGKTEPIQLASH